MADIKCDGISLFISFIKYSTVVFSNGFLLCMHFVICLTNENRHLKIVDLDNKIQVCQGKKLTLTFELIWRRNYHRHFKSVKNVLCEIYSSFDGKNFIRFL